LSVRTKGGKARTKFISAYVRGPKKKERGGACKAKGNDGSRKMRMEDHNIYEKEKEERKGTKHQTD